MLYIGIDHMYISRLGITDIRLSLALRYYCGLEKRSLDQNSLGRGQCYLLYQQIFFKAKYKSTFLVYLTTTMATVEVTMTRNSNHYLWLEALLNDLRHFYVPHGRIINRIQFVVTLLNYCEL